MISGLLTGLARLTFAHRASRIYLGLVAVVALWVGVDTLFVHHQDASFAGVWLFFVTAPTVFLFLFGDGLFSEPLIGSSGFLCVAVVFSALIQSAALGAFVRLLQGGSESTAHPSGA
jgi:hypothetical protein